MLPVEYKVFTKDENLKGTSLGGKQPGSEQ